MKREASYAVLGIVVVIASAQAKQVASVDLTKPPEASRTDGASQRSPLPNGCENLGIAGYMDGIVVAEEGHPRPRITVSVVRVNNKAPATGNEVVAEVRLRNTGHETVKIPWGRDLDKILAGQDPSHHSWMVGEFEVFLDGVMLANRSQKLFSSGLSTDQEIAIATGSSITATINFKLEDAFSPEHALGIGKTNLSVKWRQHHRIQQVVDCRVTNGNYSYDGFYIQTNPVFTIHAQRAPQPTAGTFPK